MCVQEMFVFGNCCQIGHDQRDTLKDYWSTLGQYFIDFYANTMKRDRVYNILTFLHFSGNRNEPDKTNENYNQLWKMKAISDNR